MSRSGTPHPIDFVKYHQAGESLPSYSRRPVLCDGAEDAETGVSAVGALVKRRTTANTVDGNPIDEVPVSDVSTDMPREEAEGVSWNQMREPEPPYFDPEPHYPVGWEDFYRFFWEGVVP